MLKEIRERAALQKIMRGLTVGLFVAVLGTVLWFTGVQGEAIGAERENEYIQSLPEDRKEMMLAVVRLGREGIDGAALPGVEAQDFYFAVQVVIWEIQQQLRVLLRDGEGLVTGTARVDAQDMSRDDFFNLVRDRPAEKCYHYLEERMNDYLLEEALTEEEGPRQPASWEFPMAEFGNEEGLWYFVPQISSAEMNSPTEPLPPREPPPALLAQNPLTQSVALEARRGDWERRGQPSPGEAGLAGESPLRPEPENPVKTPEPPKTSTQVVVPRETLEGSAAAPRELPIKMSPKAAQTLEPQKEQPTFNRLERAQREFENPSGDERGANTALLTLLISLTATGIASLLFALRREG